MNIYFSIIALALLVSLLGFLWLVVVGFKRNVAWGLLVLLFSPLTAVIFALTNWFDARKPFLVYIASLLLAIGTGVYVYTQVGGTNLQQLSARLQSGQISIDEATRLLEKALLQSGTADLFKDEVAALSDAAGEPAMPASAPVTAAATAEATAQVADPGAEAPPAMAVVEDAPASADAAGQEAESAAPQDAAAQDTESESQDEKPKETARPAYPTPDRVVPDPLAVPRQKRAEDSVLISLDKVAGYVGRYLIMDMKNGSQQRGLLARVDEKSLVLHRKLYGGSMEYRVYTSQIKTVRVLKEGSEPKS